MPTFSSRPLSRTATLRNSSELHHHAVLLTNAYATTEAARNIAATQPARLAAHERFVASVELVPLHVFDPGVTLAEKDRPILCGAISGSADHLLTGDKRDFGHLFGKTVRGVKVVNVYSLLAELSTRGIVREGVDVLPQVVEEPRPGAELVVASTSGTRGLSRDGRGHGRHLFDHAVQGAS